MGSEIKNAVITDAAIRSDDRGFLDCWLTLDYGGTGQGFGGYTLYLPKSFDRHRIESVAGHHIFRCMEIAGVGRWDHMKGRTIRVRVSESGLSGTIEAIGHIVKDDWYCPMTDFARTKGGANG
jgi:hypothetical protein